VSGDGSADARAKRLTLFATALGSGIAFLDQTVVNVALPSLRADLGATLAAQQWVVEAYLLTLGSLLLVGGSLGDVYGRRRVFAAGIAGFGVTSLLCAVAPSTGTLIAARALQGVAGALLVPASLSIISAVFPPQSGRPRSGPGRLGRAWPSSSARWWAARSWTSRPGG
jgi:MFS family permease